MPHASYTSNKYFLSLAEWKIATTQQRATPFENHSNITRRNSQRYSDSISQVSHIFSFAVFFCLLFSACYSNALSVYDLHSYKCNLCFCIGWATLWFSCCSKCVVLCSNLMNTIRFNQIVGYLQKWLAPNGNKRKCK